MNLNDKNYLFYENREIKSICLTGSSSNEPKIHEMGYGKARDSKRYVMLRDYYILQFITVGRGRLGGEAFECGDMVVIRPKQLEVREPDPICSYECAWIMAKGYVASELLRDIFPTDGRSVIKFGRTEEAAMVVKAAVDRAWCDRRISVEYSMLGVFYSLLSLIKVGSEKEADSRDPVVSALTYIELKYTDPELRAEEIAAFSGVTQNHLCKLFKRKTGQSIKEKLIDFRLSQSAVLLKSTESSVGDISYSVGFADQKHFSQMFKKHFGVTPREYRANG